MRPRRRSGRLVFWAVLAAVVATGGWFFWRAWKHAAAVREAQALGWKWEQDSALELIKQDWKNAFKGETWGHHPGSLEIKDAGDLTSHRALLHRLHPKQLLILKCKNADALQGLDSVEYLTLLHSPDLRSPDLRKALAGMGNLKTLDLSYCTGLEDTDGLQGLHHMEALSLIDCTGLKGAGALRGLAGLHNLKTLLLIGCTGLEDTDGLEQLHQLEGLVLSGCTSFKGAGAFKGLAGLRNLKNLNLRDCTGLESTDGMEGLHQLEKLSLYRCTGLKGAGALKGLVGLGKFKELNLSGCTGLKNEEILEQIKAFGLKCKVFGVDGKVLNPSPEKREQGPGSVAE